jgi:hypothetical protein
MEIGPAKTNGFRSSFCGQWPAIPLFVCQFVRSLAKSSILDNSSTEIEPPRSQRARRKNKSSFWSSRPVRFSRFKQFLIESRVLHQKPRFRRRECNIVHRASNKLHQKWDTLQPKWNTLKPERNLSKPRVARRSADRSQARVRASGAQRANGLLMTKILRD